MAPLSVPLAYLTPELPALSAIFVYEESLALERRGYPVLPLSVHAPAAIAKGQEPIWHYWLMVHASISERS